MKDKILVAFDFDHTIIEENSDLYIRKLIPGWDAGGQLPQEIRELYTEKNWTHYMAAIFEYLHNHGITEDDMLNCVREIAFTDGMINLINFLKSSDDFEMIIISDANSVFIDTLLKDNSVHSEFSGIYTNPAHFDESGCLRISYYHTQEWCSLSTINLCKGHVLQEHIKAAGERNVRYKLVAFVGDGSNDLCPTLKLGKGDIAFPREGFRLLKKIDELPEKLPCTVMPWSNGGQIEKALQAHL